MRALPLLAPTTPLSRPLASVIRVAQPPNLSVLPEAFAHDHYTVFAVLACASALGQTAGQTKLGKTLGGPICAMALTFALASVGVLPPATSAVTSAQGLCVVLATPLLLFGADLRTIGRRASQMLPAFVLGSVGTSVGALFACVTCGRGLAGLYGDDAYKVLAALAAKNIGGGLNFVAVAASLGLSAAPLATALAMDNLMALVYFPLCAWLGRDQVDPGADGERGDSALADTMAAAVTTAAPPPPPPPTEAELAREQSGALAVALLIVSASRHLAARYAPGFDLPLATLLAVSAATALPRAVGRYATAGTQLGTSTIFLFFATAGWAGGGLSSSVLLGGGPLLLAFLGLLYLIHLAILLGAGRALGTRPPRNLPHACV